MIRELQTKQLDNLSYLKEMLRKLEMIFAQQYGARNQTETSLPTCRLERSRCGGGRLRVLLIRLLRLAG